MKCRISLAAAHFVDARVFGIIRIVILKHRRQLIAACIAQLAVFSALGGALDGAAWIGAPGNVAPALSRAFEVRGPVKRASLVMAAPGYCEARIDGRKVGDRVLDPPPADFTKRVYATELPLELAPGRHELTVLLGHGRLDQRAASAWNNDRDKWRMEPCLKAALSIDYADGSHESVVTDESWLQVRSPLAWDDFREGEIYDPGQVLPRNGLGEHAVAVAGPKARVVDTTCMAPTRVVRTFPPKRAWRPAAGGWMFDFGEDIAGWVRLVLRGGRRGDVVSVRYDERIRPDGEPTVRVERSEVKKIGRNELWPDHARAIDCFVKSVGSGDVLPGGAAQLDRVVLGGGPVVEFEPRFTYKGFRYVWVNGIEERPEAVACLVRTDFASTGSFECSDPDFTALVRMAARSYESNWVDGIPTDCPQREKNGWTGDAQLACEFAQYAFGNADGYLKWIRDLVDAQADDGGMPGVVPTGGWGYGNRGGSDGYGPAWGAALLVVPWTLYAYRGDETGLAAAYPALCRYVDYYERHLDARGLVSDGLGDWISMSDGEYVGPAFCGTAYHYGNARIAALAAERLGRSDEASAFDAIAKRVRERFNAAHHRGNGVYGRGSQTEQSVALCFGLVPDGLVPAAEAALVEAVRRAEGRFRGGVIGSKHVFRALSRAGRSDLAFDMLTRRGSPGFMHWREEGGTALWEDWWGGFSRNHVMFADFACWAYQWLGGLRLADAPGSTAAVPVPEKPGMGSVVVAPDCIDALEWARASTETVRGRLACEWRRVAGGAIELRVDVPPDTLARVVLPRPDSGGAREHELRREGSYVFTCPANGREEKQ